MAISTYAELKDAIANWLNRSDLASRTDEFIDLAEAMFARDLRIRTMETSDQITLVLNQTDYTISSELTRFLEVRAIKVATTPVRTLKYYPPEVLSDLWGVDPSGDVRGYTLEGDTLRVAPAPDASNAVAMTVVYYQKFIGLSATNTTNDLLTNHPDIYLYGSLLQAEPYLLNDERIPIWKTFYEQAIQRAMASDQRGNHGGPPRDATTR